MEIKFEKSSCRCLRRLVSQVQQRELTQEVRLPEAMPDIGRVLGSWGQVLVRGKEWNTGGMTVSGGVMAWVLYAPEDGSEPRSLETWIPFQMKWDLPQTERDGFISVVPRMHSMDARSTSARKLMVRPNISLLGQAMIGSDTELYQPEQVPEDVQLLTNSYPMELPVEFGEKLFQLDEELTVPGTYPTVEKLLRYEMAVQITEQKIMASRLVFKGKAILRILYCSDGSVYAWDTEIPFSQFADLDRDYGSDAIAVLTPMVTNLEVESADGRLSVKAGIAVQFTVMDRMMVALTEDAYSPMRQVRCQWADINLPARLDQRSEQMQVSQSLNAEASKVVDVSWLPDHPQWQHNGDITGLRMTGSMQVLYYDTVGMLQCGTLRYEQEQLLPAAPDAVVDAFVREEPAVQAIINGTTVEISAGYWLDTAVYAGSSQSMVTGLELSDAAQSDPGRPSLILRRYDSSRLWDIAKEHGSTVEAIRRANQLQSDPEPDQMLLIPVS